MKAISSNRILSIAVIILLLANTILLVLMWKEKNRHATGRQAANNGPFEMMVRELNMNEQQKNDYQKLRDEYFNSVRPLFDSIREIRKDLVRLIRDSTDGDSASAIYSKRIAEKQVAIDKLTFGHFRKVRTLFTGEQQKKFDNFLQKMMLQRLNGSRRRDSLNRKP
ncbi:MAG TPA: Spy/CpxP family protein refolding chaperone [Chitinophagaceae bacterium]|nr:Spy/CpxP family protein refolding chaperone [Chitinophagaceae bacterium]